MSINTGIIWDKAIELWNHFDERFTKAGYKLHIVCGERGLTDKTVALKDDRYAPIIEFLLFRMHKNEYTFSIEVIDRNGNNVLDGKSIGYFRFSEYTEEKLDEAINYVLTTFGCYDEDNTVPTKFEEIQKTF